MTNEKRPRLDTFNRHVNNVYPALTLLAGMQLDVFTPLADGPLTAEELAAVLNVRADKLQPLLYALVTAEMLTVEGGRFANTEESAHFLVKGKPSYIGGQRDAFADLWSATLQTAESIRKGKPQAKHDFAAMSHDELSAFIRSLDAGAGAAARRLMRSFDFTPFRHVLDAGGGSGGLAVGLCRQLPELRATVADLPSVAAITRQCIAEAEMADRISVQEANLVQAPPQGHFDAAVLRSLIQVLSRDDAASVIRNVGAAVGPGGQIFIVGRVLDDSRVSPLDAVTSNVMFLNIYDDGQAYTEGEHRQWLEAAGFIDVGREQLSGGYSIVSGTKAKD